MIGATLEIRVESKTYGKVNAKPKTWQRALYKQ
jgi:hypothetical protein